MLSKCHGKNSPLIGAKTDSFLELYLKSTRLVHSTYLSVWMPRCTYFHKALTYIQCKNSLYILCNTECNTRPKRRGKIIAIYGQSRVHASPEFSLDDYHNC